MNNQIQKDTQKNIPKKPTPNSQAHRALKPLIKRSVLSNPSRSSKQIQERKIKFVIFDFGEVFVKDMDKAMKIYTEKTGVDVHYVFMEQMKPQWKAWERGEITEAEFNDAFVKEVNSDKFDVKEMWSRFWSLMRRDEAITELIKQLRHDGYTTALLTNNTKEWIEEYNQRDPFDQYFDLVISSHAVGMVKPDPRIYELTMRRLGAKPEECIFVDDKERNTKAAEAVGMNVVMLKSSEQAISEVYSLLKRVDCEKR